MTFLGAEIVLIDSWVDTKLRASAALTAIASTRVFNRLAPKGTLYPLVIFQDQSIRDIRGVGPDRIMVDTLYLVKAVAQADDYSILKALVNAIDVAMTVPNGENVTGGMVMTSVRDEPFALTEVEDGKQFRHLGGLYRIYAQAT